MVGILFEIEAEDFSVSYVHFVTYTLISLISVEVGINVEGVQKLPNH